MFVLHAKQDIIFLKNKFPDGTPIKYTLIKFTPMGYNLSYFNHTLRKTFTNEKQSYESPTNMQRIENSNVWLKNK